MADSKLLVRIAQGDLVGKYVKDHNGKGYCSFHSIPYAKPPIGNLRFKAPQPPEKWCGLRDARIELDECVTPFNKNMTSLVSEDCLTLNVYTRELPEIGETLKPVMFCIHGGNFIAGSSKTKFYGPEYLIRKDIVLVTVNYRLGVLGFLSLEDPTLGVPGNAGMKDLVMALRWVRDNVKTFNGNPENVTIFGNSAGGIASHLMMLSPMAKGLFHKVISQSGCALNFLCLGRRFGPELTKHLGCFTQNEREILTILQNTDARELCTAQTKLYETFKVCDIRPIGIVIEKGSEQEAFLTEEPIEIIKKGNYSKVPMIIGYTSCEGMICTYIEKLYKKNLEVTNFEDAIPYMLKLKRGSVLSKLTAARIKQFYYGNEEPNIKNISRYYRMQGDTYFYRGIHTSIKLHVETSTQPVYFYRFSFEGNLNIYKKIISSSKTGVSHADELGYMFCSKATSQITPGRLEIATIERITSLWTNFARTGNPNAEEFRDLIPVIWEPVKKNEINYLEIGDNVTVGLNPDADRMRFWDSIEFSSRYTSRL